MSAREKGRWTGRPARLLLWIVLIAAVAVAGFLLSRSLLRTGELLPPEAGEQSEETPTTPAIRAVVLVFADSDASGSVSEERQIASHDRLEDDLLAVMQALCDGPTSRNAVGVMPPGARPLAVFYDEKAGSVVLDFSPELATNHPGGSAGEQATIAGIMRTIALNFPEVRACSILVGGAQIESLAGHIGLEEPFDPRRWR